MCWWGEALAHGPNINAPMDAERERSRGRRPPATRNGWRAKATPAERALADAMVKRYSLDPRPTVPRSTPHMRTRCWPLPRRIPRNDDIALLAAEAAMDTLPWNYWEADGRTPKPRLGEA